MKLKALAMGAATAALLAVPTVANAAWSQTTGDVNMRAGPSTNYQRITTLPAGARVWVNGSAGHGWLSVRYNGRNGYVSANYVADSYVGRPGPQRPPIMSRPPPPRYGYWHKPRWDSRHHAWYDGRRWYRNGIWYNDPSGFYFGFRFGG